MFERAWPDSVSAHSRSGEITFGIERGRVRDSHGLIPEDAEVTRPAGPEQGVNQEKSDEKELCGDAATKLYPRNLCTFTRLALAITMVIAMPLQRSSKNVVIGGVCGGIAESLGWDPVMVRILYLLVSILSAAFPGLLIYVILWIAMPRAE